jgi:hypothetical protein
VHLHRNVTAAAGRSLLWQPAVGKQVDRLVGLDIVFRQTGADGKLRRGKQAFGQFEMIADVEELYGVPMIFAEAEKGVRAREAMIRQPSSSAWEIGPEDDCPTSRYGKTTASHSAMPARKSASPSAPMK